MSKLNRFVLTSICAVALLGSVGCGRRLPATPDAEPSAQPGAPTTPDQPPAPQPPGPAPTTAPPAPDQPPAPQPPAPQPPGPAPTTPPPAPDQPPVPPDQPPAPVNPGNPAVEKFWAQLGEAGFTDQAAITAELKKTAALKITGWSKGKFETPDQNVEEMFKITAAMFVKPAADPAEYAARSMAFAQQPLDGCTLFVDLKASAEHKNIYVLKHDPGSKQIVGINEKDIEYNPGISAMNAVRRLDGAVEGKIFFYGEENGKFLDPARFVAIPPEVINPAAAGAIQAMRARTAVTQYQARSVYPYRR